MAEAGYRAYDPLLVEEKWYSFWEAKGFFHADPDSPKPPYCIVIPPPNITGSLHMGHALNNTLQDILIRWRRMQGYNALWMPGTDHAGIATQNVVERQLHQEGLSRQEVGREEFLRRVWQWKEESGGTIIKQLKKLGASCDWVRERFTMDPGLSRAVIEVFVRLFEDGLLYRAERLVNWCPRCETALSDIEVAHEEIDGHLWHVRYPFADEPSKGLVVATTRPETILGDTAVAVHPEDDRYRGLLGRTLLLPVVGRKIPVIADPYVSREFGTGALKVTPGHDPNDFEIGGRHGLPVINAFSSEGKINPAFLVDEKGNQLINQRAARYVARDRYEVRRMIVEDIAQDGLLVKVEPYRHSIGHCYRCKTHIEPYLTPQWFVRVKPLAESAIRAVGEGRVRIVPAQWEKNYFEWMVNIRDWCISRQIWWGHQIPAWYCLGCDKEHIIEGGIGAGFTAEGGAMPGLTERIFIILPEVRPIVRREKPPRCDRCGSEELIQDPDVLDTWFSSALWPFSTLGWPERTKELQVFYPTSVLVTGFDILFFWVARMIMMGLSFVGDVPFREVHIHALVRDAEGQKMSKSRGNIIDPLVMIDRYGADSLRFTLAALAVQGRDIRLAEERIEGYRHFSNKLWNAARFVLLHLSIPHTPTHCSLDHSKLQLADRWILSRLQDVIAEVTEALESYRFNDAASALYQFLWHEYCDWYLEIVKTRLSEEGDQGERATGLYLMHHILEVILRMLHPFMPFITEEIWQRLPHQGESIMVAPWPQPDPSYRTPEVADFQKLMEGVRAVRNLRSEYQIPVSQRLPHIYIEPRTPGGASILEKFEGNFLHLTKASELKVGQEAPPFSATAATPAWVVHVPLKGVLDLEKERERLKREIGKRDRVIDRVNRKLSSEDFLRKAPEEVIAKERAARREALEDKARLQQKLQMVEACLKG
ncbi:MAG: valine--tRNA ligase [candidate division NC10 bacterium]|nr:valine--tRNA ligase [candidate division NC10 bacterium]